jgi:hypothetical protein
MTKRKVPSEDVARNVAKMLTSFLCVALALVLVTCGMVSYKCAAEKPAAFCTLKKEVSPIKNKGRKLAAFVFCFLR